MTIDPTRITDVNGDCPNLVEMVLALIAASAEKSKAKICEEIQSLHQIVLAGDASAQAQIDQINLVISQVTNIPDFTSQIQALTTLINSLDLDEDGNVVNDLQNILAIAEQALTAANNATEGSNNASSLANTANNAVTALTQVFNDFRVTITEGITNLTQRISQCERNITLMGNTITQLEAQIEQMEVDHMSLYCDLGKAFRDTAAAFSARLDTIFEGPCLVAEEAPPESPNFNAA